VTNAIYGASEIDGQKVSDVTLNSSNVISGRLVNKVFVTFPAWRNWGWLPEQAVNLKGSAPLKITYTVEEDKTQCANP